MSDFNAEVSYYDWRLNKDSNLLYNRFVNFDVIWPSYSESWWRKRPTSFFLKKRKWYTKSDNWIFIGWYVTDIVEMPASSCWWSDDSWTYYHLVSKDKSMVRILFSKQCEVYDIVYEWSRCECSTDKFIVTDFVKWSPKYISTVWNINWSSYWVQINKTVETLSEWRLQDSYDDLNIWSWKTKISIWDYVYVFWSTYWTDEAACWQVRQILWYERKNKNEDGKDTLLLSSPRLWINEKWKNATYMIFPEWWKIVWWTTTDWLMLLHSPYELLSTWVKDYTKPVITQTCQLAVDVSGWQKCMKSIVENNWFIHILYDNWYNMYWQQWYNKFYFSLWQQNLLWPDTITTATFRSFLIWFWDRTINVSVPLSTWLYQSYPILDNVWIYWPSTFCYFQDSMYFLANDRRLYAISISAWSSWWTPTLKLEDMSWLIKWDLDLIKEWDDVYLDADSRQLRIYINWKSDRSNKYNDKTKILIYEKDHWVRHEHHLWWIIIRWKKLWYVLWDWLYRYCWRTDWEQYINSYVDTFIWEHESSSWFNMFQKKKLKWAKLLLWRWIYTSSTVLSVDCKSWWYTSQYNVSTFEDIEWVKQWNDVARWNEPTVKQCSIDAMSDHTYAKRECKWSRAKLWAVETTCWWCTDDIVHDDYQVCIDDVWYALSEIRSVYVPLEDLVESDLIRIRLISWEWDILVFWWMLVEIINNPIGKHDDEDMLFIADWRCQTPYIWEQNLC